MQLYIPEIGDRLRLTKDWTFTLHYEHRNSSLIEHFGDLFEWRRRSGNDTEPNDKIVTIPLGTILKVDRIYIRKGLEEWSSISFYAEGIGTGSGAFGRPKSARFWAKLSDCNKIEFEIEELKDVSKPPLHFFAVQDIKKTGSTSSMTKKPPASKTMVINSVIYAGKKWSSKDERYKVEISYTENYTYRSEQAYSDLMGLRRKTAYYFDIRRPDLKYKLFTTSGEQIGEYGTLAALKKSANEHYKNN